MNSKRSTTDTGVFFEMDVHLGESYDPVKKQMIKSPPDDHPLRRVDNQEELVLRAIKADGKFLEVKNGQESGKTRAEGSYPIVAVLDKGTEVFRHHVDPPLELKAGESLKLRFGINQIQQPAGEEAKQGAIISSVDIVATEPEEVS